MSEDEPKESEGPQKIRSKARRVTPAQPVSGSETPKRKTRKKASKSAAATILERARAEKKRLEEARKEKDLSDVVYVWRCRQGHIGAIFTGKPDGLLKTEDWTSAYKEEAQEWPAIPHCQECRAPLPVLTHPGGGLTARDRFIGKLERPHYEYLVGELSQEDYDAWRTAKAEQEAREQEVQV